MKVVLKYDLGDGEVILRSKQRIQIDTWTSVDIELKGRYASLRINKRQATKGASRGRSSSLQLTSRTLVYIGGEKDILNTGLHGCIQQLRVNGHKIDLVNDYLKTHAFSSCYKALSPCLSHPCLNKGKCDVSSPGKFRCTCANDYEGEVCGRKIKMCGEHLGCRNGGECWRNRLTGKSICRCSLGYGGGSCQKGAYYKVFFTFFYLFYFIKSSKRKLQWSSIYNDYQEIM